MTKAVLEAEGEGAAARAVAAVPSPALAVPASLHASLMARLDRLGNAKAVAQIGAAIGREFSHALARGGGELTEAGAGFGAGPAPSVWADVSPGRAAGRDLSLQARSRSRHGLRHAVARAPTRAARPHRGGYRKPIPRLRTRASPSCWRVTAPRLGWSRGRRACGARRGDDRWLVRRSSKPRAFEARAGAQIEPCRGRSAATRGDQAADRADDGALCTTKGYAATETKEALEHVRNP